MKKGKIISSLENFWYYYKWHTIGVVVLVLLLAFFVSNLSVKEEPCDVKIMSVFSQYEAEGSVNLDEYLKETISDADQNGKKQIKREAFYITASGTSGEDSVYLSQIERNMGYARADMVLLDETNYERFKPKDYLEDLSDFVDLSQFDEDSLVYRNEKVVAINLKGSNILSELKFRTDNLYAGIMFIPEDNAEKYYAGRENAAKIIEELYKK